MKTAYCILWATPRLQHFSLMSDTKAVLIATLIHSYEQNHLIHCYFPVPSPLWLNEEFNGRLSELFNPTPAVNRVQWKCSYFIL